MPTKLQVFIGTGKGDVFPHPFYQVFRVKNFTNCAAKTIAGTAVLEMNISPTNNMMTVCDCIGIIKQRNFDVQHRCNEGDIIALGLGNRKKATNVRLIFRTGITHPDGSFEALQITSDPINCTQQQPEPEVLTMSWRSCPANGGLELFVIGKNFTKDSKVVFYEGDESMMTWRVFVLPVKEYLHQCHLVCIVPPYLRVDIRSPVQVRVVVESSDKISEPQPFAYTPVIGYLPTSPIARSFPEPSDVLDVFLLEVRCRTVEWEYDEGSDFHPILLWTSQSVEASQSCLCLAIRGLRQGRPSTIPPIPLCIGRLKCTLPIRLMTLQDIEDELESSNHMILLSSQSKGNIASASSSSQNPSQGEANQLISELNHPEAIKTHSASDQKRKSRQRKKLFIDRKTIITRKQRPRRKLATQSVLSKSLPTIECTDDVMTSEHNILSEISYNKEYVVESPMTEQAIRSLDDFVNLAAESHISSSQSFSSSSSLITSPFTSPEKSSEGAQKSLSPTNTVSTIVPEETESHIAQRVVDMMLPFDSSSQDSIPDHMDTMYQPNQQMDVPTQNYSFTPPPALPSSPPHVFAADESTKKLDVLDYPAQHYRIIDSPTLSSSSSAIFSPYTSPNNSAVVSPDETRTSSSPPANPFTPKKQQQIVHQLTRMMSQPQSSRADYIPRPMGSMNLPTIQQVASCTSPAQEPNLSSFQSNSPLPNDMRESLNQDYLNMILEKENNRKTEAEYSMGFYPYPEITVSEAIGYNILPTVSNLIQSQASSVSHAATNISLRPMSTSLNTPGPHMITDQNEPFLPYRSISPGDHVTVTSVLQHQNKPAEQFAKIEDLMRQQVELTPTPPIHEPYLDFPQIHLNLPDTKEELNKNELMDMENSETRKEYSLVVPSTSGFTMNEPISYNTWPLPNLIQSGIYQSSTIPYTISHQIRSNVQQMQMHNNPPRPMTTSMMNPVTPPFSYQNEQLPSSRAISLRQNTNFSMQTHHNRPSRKVAGVGDLSVQQVTYSTTLTQQTFSSSIHLNLPLQSPFPEMREDLNEDYLREMMDIEDRETRNAEYSMGICPVPEIAVSGPIGFNSLPSSSLMQSQVQLYNVAPFPRSSQGSSNVKFMPSQIPSRPMSTGLSTPIPPLFSSQNEPDAKTAESENSQNIDKQNSTNC